MKFEGFVGPTYALLASADAQRTVNLYPEVVESGTGKVKVVFRTTPGLITFATLPYSPVRGLWSGGGRCFAAAGSRVLEVFSNGTYTELGVIATDADNSPVQIFPNGTQLYIVASGKAYIHNGVSLSQPQWVTATGTVNTSGTAVVLASGDPFTSAMVGNPFIIGSTTYTVASYSGPASIALTTSAGVQVAASYTATTPVLARTGAFLDGYFIAFPPDSKSFFISPLNNGEGIWDVLDVSVKEGYPDNISCGIADHQDLWVMGTETIEVWRNDGGSDFPFRRDQGAVMQVGNVAPWSTVRLGSGPAWLSGDATGSIVAYRAQGFQPIRISTYAQEQAWAAYTRVDDAAAYTYSDGGHTFWVINFPTGDATWVYDLSTGMWHQRAYGASNRQRGLCHTFIFGKHLVGDHSSGILHLMSNVVYQDSGQPIYRIRTAPYIAEEDKRLFFSRFALDIHDNAGNHAAATLEWSDDGGTTWTTPRTPNTSLAAAGVMRQMVWRRLGTARYRTFRVIFSAAASLSIFTAYLDVAKGTD